MIKIVHIVISANYKEGMSYQENLLSAKHVELGYDVTVIARQLYVDREGHRMISESGEHVGKDGVKIIVLRETNVPTRFALFFDTCKGLYETINEAHPDILFVHNFTSPDVRHIARYMKTHPEVELYVDCHSDYFNNPNKTNRQKFVHWVKKQYGRKLLPYAKVYWGTTPWRVQFLQDVYNIPSSRTGLLIMGADETKIIGRNREEVRKEIRNHYGIPGDAFVVVTGGTLDKRKQQDLLLESVKNMREENVWLIVFGKPTADMEQVIEKYRSVENIVLTGWLASDKAYDMFFASDLAVFPGTHSVLWEQAAACGIPVVVKHWEGMEHINAGGNAVLLNEVSVKTISEVIRSLTPISSNQYRSLKSAALNVADSFYLREIAKKSIGK